jgi:hypothetical protein
MQPVPELDRADAVALAREAVVLPDRLTRAIRCSGKLGRLDMVAAGGDSGKSRRL